jgi:hypothetical protein
MIILFWILRPSSIVGGSECYEETYCPYHEDGGSVLLLNFGTSIPHYTMSVVIYLFALKKRSSQYLDYVTPNVWKAV